MSNPQIINSYIEAGLSRQDSETVLLEYINARIEELMPFVTSSRNPGETLVSFVKKYIGSVPKYLNAFSQLSVMTKVDSYTSPFLTAAITLFLESHPVVDNAHGLKQLLYKAYFCHRMLEEINDRMTLERRVPLVPVDMAHANLIAHTIIGDKDANALDQTILIQLELINVELSNTCRELFKEVSIRDIASVMAQQGWKAAYDQWPFLKEDMTDILLD